MYHLVYISTRLASLSGIAEVNYEPPPLRETLNPEPMKRNDRLGV